MHRRSVFPFAVLSLFSVSAPLFSACAPIYNAAMAQGLAQHDTASVCEVLGDMAGISSAVARVAVSKKRPPAAKRRRKLG